ncbi:MAG: carboxypeptidase-like regulatory domain-containing protein, partial [Muribaculaceae bacterium]|nr:carboxypeptidase-like regulatory domain-containing protein [Muribaculaceae bacterium]
AQGRILSSRLAFVYPPEVPDSLIGPGDYAVSVTAADYAVPDTTNSIVAQLLLQSELGDYVEDAAYYFRRPDRTARADLNALLLTQDWKRYDLPAVIGGKITEPQMPMEIGGELSGMVKSRWRGKPLEGADVNVLAPSMEYAATVKTDAQGRFTVTGVDWPDGTAFVFQATGKKGDREHNFEVDRDRFPENNSVIIPRWHAADTASDPDFGPILGYGSDILLNEITVTAAKSEEEMHAAMFQALGVKSVTDADMAARNFTTYEECLRNIPGIRIVNGAVYSTRASSIYGSGTGVEFWVDGSLWNSFSLTGAAYLPSLRFMQPIGEQYTPVSLPKADAVKLSEFENAYPLSTIKSIEYYNSSIALMISSSAAYNGGALVFKTKSYDKTPDWETQLFTRVVTPFGYQNKPATYRPYYQYRETIDGTVNTSVWTPITDKVDSVDCQSKRAVISGISDDNEIIFIIK